MSQASANARLVREVDLGYAICGDIGTVEEFLQKGTLMTRLAFVHDAIGWDPNTVDEFRDTPLHGAALNNQEAIVKILFKAGANLFARNMYKENKHSTASALQALMATPEGLRQASLDTGRSQQKDAQGRRKVYDLSQVTHGQNYEDGKAARNANTKPLMEWTPQDVVDWMTTCRLSRTEQYSTMIIQHAIDEGEVLHDMRSKEDWHGLGIVIFGDVRKLLKKTSYLRLN